MPSKHVLRQFPPHSYVHVYNRGVEKRPIYSDQQDRRVFFSLLERYLNPLKETNDSDGIRYVDYSDDVELQCFCLMENHFHLVFWVGDNPTLLSEFMRALSNSYTLYFNKKYERVGALFQGRFKTTLVESNEQLIHLSRYVHLNPSAPLTYPFSSIQTFVGNQGFTHGFLNPTRLKDILGSMDYLSFLMEIAVA